LRYVSRNNWDKQAKPTSGEGLGRNEEIRERKISNGLRQRSATEALSESEAEIIIDPVRLWSKAKCSL
jgi:hypothetical protein